MSKENISPKVKKSISPKAKERIIKWSIIAVVILCLMGSPLGPLIVKAVISLFEFVITILRLILKLTGFFGGGL